jgi:hypothetical protein
LPVVITSNVEYRPFVEGGFTLYDVMGNAGASRLMEMTQGITYLIEGEDRR